MRTPHHDHAKLTELAARQGTPVEQIFGNMDSLAPGICMNLCCDFITDYEPDQRAGYCEVCGTQTVCSALVLGGIL